MFKKLFVLVVFVFIWQPFIVPGQLKIGIIGDQTGSTNLSKSYKILQEGCHAIAKYEPELVLHVGDVLESSKSDDEIRQDFAQAAGYLSSIKVQGKKILWYVAAGDHDVSPPNDYTPGTKNKTKEKLFLNLLRSEYDNRSLNPITNHLYYSFNFKDYHFICLYSEETLRTDPRWSNIFMNKIGNDQYRWLKADLNNTLPSQKIIVFLHQPMWYNWTGWKKVHNLLRTYNVIAVIAGHYHYNQDEGTTDGIRYLVVGSTGANIKNASENAGGLYHVTLLTVDYDSINMKLIPLKNYSQNIFSQRIDMDRVQAIDTMLTTMEWNPKTTLEANPIDIPVNIYINQDSWQLLYEVVPPGMGVTLSNLSSVELKTGSRPLYLRGMKVEFWNREGQRFWVQNLFDSL